MISISLSLLDEGSWIAKQVAPRSAVDAANCRAAESEE